MSTNYPYRQPKATDKTMVCDFCGQDVTIDPVLKFFGSNDEHGRFVASEAPTKEIIRFHTYRIDRQRGWIECPRSGADLVAA